MKRAEVDKVCHRCKETIPAGTLFEYTPCVGCEGVTEAAYHYECFARGIIGSVGHLKKQCTCYGGTMDDPPEMTKREAAQAALDLLRSMRPA